MLYYGRREQQCVTRSYQLVANKGQADVVEEVRVLVEGGSSEVRSSLWVALPPRFEELGRSPLVKSNSRQQLVVWVPKELCFHFCEHQGKSKNG